MTPGEWGKNTNLSNVPCHNFSEEKSTYDSNSATGMHAYELERMSGGFFSPLFEEIYDR